jgi:hypothetical protein
MINLEERHPHQYVIMLVSFLVIFAFLYGVSAYVIVGVNSDKLLPKLGISRFCATKNNSVFQAKLVSYHKPKGEAKLFCLYENKDENRILRINKVNEKWVLSSDEIMYNNKWIWPIY